MINHRDKNNPFYGKKHTLKTKEKMRQKALGRKCYWKNKKLSKATN